MDKLEKFILKCTLENAVKYGGKSDLNSVLGSVFAKEKKADKPYIISLTKKIVDNVNTLLLSQQEEQLNELGHLKKQIKRKKDPSLPNVKGKVVMRFAPNPNGYMSFGHIRPALWNWFFVQKYKGTYIVRFDDTDPRTKVPLKEAYKSIQQDLKWLCINPHKIIIQSKRLKIYYTYAAQLIKQGNAYIDTLPAEQMKKMLWDQKISDEREESPAEVMKKWKKMFTYYKDGEAILRIKTNINHPNPSLRDWPAFRIITKPKHPLVNARVWPLLNFASAIDDHELKVTHIIRGIDLEVSDDKQKFIYNYFKWKYPETIYHGKFFISDISSTSEAIELIKEKKLTGWDDPRLGTVAALRKRGFQAQSIVNFIHDLGIGRSDFNVNIDSLAAHNREIIDKKAKRFFVVFNPKNVKIDNAPKMKIKTQCHPDFPNLGYRIFHTSNKFYVDETFEPSKYYRFIDLFNFINLKHVSTELNPNLKAKPIHWLPVTKNLVKIHLVMPDNSVQRGLGEPALKKVKVGDIVQFMRIGFARCDKKLKNEIIFYFAHK